ncbi:hypothetical protein BS50DRAFT_101717 [Corynespora cassiicola Philippines]|uniref:Uncharacterized protein n=1 Tax=Corynespora cassiicola Philippines TaxID=1448308 RepID=A0A2T2NC07_CORCC|nr:hypothetical protein BS50DRAFT_101717 [Corynespora cassiicola Philippines]
MLSDPQHVEVRWRSCVNGKKGACSEWERSRRRLDDVANKIFPSIRDADMVSSTSSRRRPAWSADRGSCAVPHQRCSPVRQDSKGDVPTFKLGFGGFGSGRFLTGSWASRRRAKSQLHDALAHRSGREDGQRTEQRWLGGEVAPGRSEVGGG